MNKTVWALVAFWLVGLEPAQSVQLGRSEGTRLTPRDFRELTNHHNKPCTESELQCLGSHLWYLACGAVIVEKLPMSEAWLIFSMHSGPKLPLDHVLFLMPGIAVGDGLDLDSWEETAPQFVQQTLAWMDSRDWTNADLCELRAYWSGLSGINGNIRGEQDTLSIALWRSVFRLIEDIQPSAVQENGLSSTIGPRKFRETFGTLQVPPCTVATPGCLAERLMYLECGAVLVEKLTLPDRDPPEQWYVYSLHGSPKVSFDAFLYFSPEFFVGNLYSTTPFDEFESRIRVNGPYDRDFIPNSQLHDFAQKTVAWMESQDWTVTDLCELQAHWMQEYETEAAPAE